MFECLLLILCLKYHKPLKTQSDSISFYIRKNVCTEWRENQRINSKPQPNTSPKQISRWLFSFGLKYFLGMFSPLSLSFLSITIVNIALFVLKFLNLPQGDILTKAEKHFETLKDTCLPLPIWYQDGFN